MKFAITTSTDTNKYRINIKSLSQILPQPMRCVHHHVPGSVNNYPGHNYKDFLLQ